MSWICTDCHNLNNDESSMICICGKTRTVEPKEVDQDDPRNGFFTLCYAISIFYIISSIGGVFQLVVERLMSDSGNYLFSAVQLIAVLVPLILGLMFFWFNYAISVQKNWALRAYSKFRVSLFLFFVTGYFFAALVFSGID